uniref:(California timema) hypothetical protein n=1 Tax=Timema californicum TaxID=61474 RepID=A0A7R9P9U0_TIMCA|nr:unnamed protein product [Timema californicum]
MRAGRRRYQRFFGPDQALLVSIVGYGASAWVQQLRKEATPEHVVFEFANTAECREELQIPLPVEAIYHILRDMDRWSLLDSTVGKVSKRVRDKYITELKYKRQVLKCSRFLLGLASPVFNAMFKGGGFGNPILVPDVEPRVFEKMLRFLSEKIEFESKDEVAEICVLARRYRIQDLVNLCSDHLQPQSLKDFWRALDCAVRCNMRPLKDDLMEFFQEHSKDILGSERILTVGPESLSLIVKQETMSIDSELEVIQAVFGWGRERCVKARVPDSGEHLRETLDVCDILQHLRFLSLTESEFLDGPARSGIFTPHEMVDILLNLSSKGYSSPNIYFSTNTSHRNPKRRRREDIVKDIYLRKTPGIRSSQVRLTVSMDNITVSSEPRTISEYFTVTDNSPVIIKTVLLTSQILPEENAIFRRHFHSYEEDISVQLLRWSSWLCVYEKVGSGSFKGAVNYGEDVIVDMSEGEESFYEELKALEWILEEGSSEFWGGGGGGKIGGGQGQSLVERRSPALFSRHRRMTRAPLNTPAHTPLYPTDREERTTAG